MDEIQLMRIIICSAIFIKELADVGKHRSIGSIPAPRPRYFLRIIIVLIANDDEIAFVSGCIKRVIEQLKTVASAIAKRL